MVHLYHARCNIDNLMGNTTYIKGVTMKLSEAVKIVKRWHAGGYATQIVDMNPAILMLIEAGEKFEYARKYNLLIKPSLLPGETKD